MVKWDDKLYECKCVKCGKIDLLKYKSYWYRKNKSLNMCRSCVNKNPWNKGTKGLTTAWNKGLNISGMSGKKQSEKHHLSLIKRNKINNVAKRKEVREKMRLKKLGLRNEKTNAWKGGKSKIGNAIRRTVDYKIWRLKVLERDKFTCRICNISGQSLDVHHIKHFADYPELIFNINNGISLCKKCHRKIHYGH